jgi:hypothetical protein
MNTKGAAVYIGCSKSYLDKAAIARQRAQEEAEVEAELSKIGPPFRWIGHRREYDQPHLDDFKRATTVEPRRRNTAVQHEIQSEI